MILERLRDLHARIQDELIPSYHKQQGCRWILEIGPDGSFQGFTETGQTKRSATDFNTPYRKRSRAESRPRTCSSTSRRTCSGYRATTKRSGKRRHRSGTRNTTHWFANVQTRLTIPR